MIIGELFLKAISTGVISETELSWIVQNQLSFSSCEYHTATQLGHLVDSGKVNLACRI